MTLKAGSGVVVLVGVLIAGSGCGSQQTRIAQLDPYLGARPGPTRRLPQRRPKRPQVVQVRPDRGWMPARGISNRWRYVVIHHSGSDKSTPQGMRDWHVNGRGWQALGYHFAIGNGVGYGDGKVYVGERWPNQMHGAHCKTPSNEHNNHGIGICLIGDLNGHPPTPKQVQSLARLLSFLSEKCGIPKSHILTHGGVTHKTECPGRCFALRPVLQMMSSQPFAAVSE